MAKRDQEQTARNKIALEITSRLRILLPLVLRITGFDSEHSLHGKIGGKFAEYIDIKNAIITSPDHFISLWLQGYIEKLEKGSGQGNAYDTYDLLKRHKIFRDYLYLFLERVYIRNYPALSRKKPILEEAEIWIGQENANYGILIAPRFTHGKWENDKSEIRHFPHNYWSIGHVLETGLLIPNKEARLSFKSVKDYLSFFEDVIVRNSGSRYEQEIAGFYSDFVLRSSDPENVPLLIPELRYDGIAKKHMYRLDFTIIEPIELNKIGFELSPWSTHGYLSKINGLSQKAINDMAKDNFEKEMKKHKDYFRKYGIFTLIYTDSDLNDTKSIFNEMVMYLTPKSAGTQIRFHILDDFFN